MNLLDLTSKKFASLDDIKLLMKKYFHDLNMIALENKQLPFEVQRLIVNPKQDYPPTTPINYQPSSADRQ